jgi:Tol biopolymer transport system component
MTRLSTTALVLLALAVPAAAGTVTGTPDADRLTGGTTADTLFGGPGADMLWGDPTSGIGAPRAMERVSLGLDGKEATNGISQFSLSADGRWMVFVTSAPEFLPPAFANGKLQVFLKDMESGKMTLLSRTAAGAVGNGASFAGAISADGSTAALITLATDLMVASPDPGDQFVVAIDLKTGTMRVASPLIDTAGSAAYGSLHFSADGKRLAYVSSSSYLFRGIRIIRPTSSSHNWTSPPSPFTGRPPRPTDRRR